MFDNCPNNDILGVGALLLCLSHDDPTTPTLDFIAACIKGDKMRYLFTSTDTRISIIPKDATAARARSRSPICSNIRPFLHFL
jgi:hypothetical protein